MKRIFCIIPPAAACLMFAACSAPKEAAGAALPPDIPFSAEADITYGGEDCKVQIRRLEAGNWEFCVTEPYPAEGLVITVSDGVTKLKMYDMETIADINADAVSMARAVAAAYDSAASGGADTAQDGGKSVSGSSEFGAYSIQLGEDDCPETLDASVGKLSVKFTKFAYLERDLSEPEIIE